MQSYLPEKIIPPKLGVGDVVRIVAPSRSLRIIDNAIIDLAKKRFEELGLCVTFGRNVNDFDSDLKYAPSSLRVSDLHEAFADDNVKAIFTVIGGFNCNQLLHHLDYSLIMSNPKIFCGYSDITALQNAILAKTGLVTYSGPHFSTLGMLHGIEYSLKYLKYCLFDESPFSIKPSSFWRNDPWYINQEVINLRENEGFTVLRPGRASGTIIGGNLCTFTLLKGTEFMPISENFLLFLEEDGASKQNTAANFDCYLQSLLYLPGFVNGLRGIILGRFEEASRISKNILAKIIDSKDLLPNNIPIVYGIDFGHTEPHITFPIGGTGEIIAKENGPIEIRIVLH